MPPKRRERSRLVDEDLINIIAQTIPGLPPIKPEVAVALASDAEYRLREIIRLGKSHMRHSKRTNLTVQDIACASKNRERQPVLGHQHSETTKSAFDLVPGNPGLFVTHDEILPLENVFKTPIPPVTQETRIQVRWLSFGDDDSDNEKQLLEGNSRKCTSNEMNSNFITLVRKAIESSHEQLLDDATEVISKANILQTHIKSLISLLTNVVDENAKSNGNSIYLENSLRIACAFASRRKFGAEIYVDELLTLSLTCAIGRQVGDGDQWSVREVAAHTVGHILKVCGNAEAQLRVEYTLLSALSDSEAPLGSIYGAIITMTQIGQTAFIKHILPLAPALMTALVHILQSIQSLEEKEESPKQDIEEAVFRVTYALEEGIRMIPQVSNEEHGTLPIMGEISI